MTDSFFRFFSRADRPLNFLSPFYLSMSVFFVCVYVCVGGGGGVRMCVCVLAPFWLVLESRCPPFSLSFSFPFSIISH